MFLRSYEMTDQLAGKICMILILLEHDFIIMLINQYVRNESWLLIAVVSCLRNSFILLIKVMLQGRK